MLCEETDLRELGKAHSEKEMAQAGFRNSRLEEGFGLGIELEKIHQILLYIKYN